MFILPGCSPRIVEKVRTEYVYQDVHHRDTLVTKDSVYIREWMKGDTVFVDKFRDRYQRYEQYTISGTKARNAISAWARPCPWLPPGPLTMLLLSGRAQSTSVKANWLCQTQHGCSKNRHFCI